MDNGEDYDTPDGEDNGREELYCANCKAPCGFDDDHCCYQLRLCHGCKAMRACDRCRRRLPDVCFADANQVICEVC